MPKLIKPGSITKDEVKRLLDFVSRVSISEDVDMMLYVEPYDDYQKGWNDAINEANRQVGIAMVENGLDVDGQSGIVYSKEWFAEKEGE